MYLVIAEKPDLGRAIAAAIPGSEPEDKRTQTIKTRWNGQPTIIIWCYGHLLTLLDPQDYDEKYAQPWSLEQLPFFFDDWKLKPKPPQKASKPGTKDSPGTKPRLDQINSLLKECDTVIHAGDIDDEGQLLVDEVLRYCKYKGPVLRLNTNDTSPAALKKALDNMEPNAAHVSAGLAAYGREIADKTFGYNLSRYYSIMNGRVLHAGRVKLPTLGLVVQRDMDIEGHKKAKHYSITANVQIGDNIIPCKFAPAKNDPHLINGIITDKAYMDEVAKKLNGLSLQNINISVNEQTEQPPLPFNLNTLYTFCSNKWGIKAGAVRDATQSLRQKYHAITYNRTNCRYLSSAQYEEAPDTVAAAAQNLGFDPAKFNTTIRSRCFDDSLVTEHTAIIPTCTKQDTSKFSPTEQKVYEAITRYYLAQFLPPAIKLITKLESDAVNGGKLVATSTVIKKPGYRALLGNDGTTLTEDNDTAEGNDTESPLSKVAPGKYNSRASDIAIVESETRPPQRYTESSLIHDMTCIAKYVTNQHVKELLLQKDKGKKDEHGSIGTPATRDIIVRELVNNGYLREEVKGKKTYLISTQMGRDFYNALPDSVKKADVSAKWWCEQEQIRAGEITPNDMGRSVLKTVEAIIKSGKGTMANASIYAKGITGTTPLGKCPKCGHDVYETAKGFKCIQDGCKFFIFKQSKFFAALGKSALTAKAVEIMLKNGRLTVKNCKSSKGNTFDATIICDFSNDSPQYSFAQAEQLQPVGICPWCQGNVVDKGKVYGCSNKECSFVIWKNNKLLEYKGKTSPLSEKNVKDLLTKQRCEITGCKSKNGKKYSCYLIIDWTDKPSINYSTEFKSGK